jgi:hypothetical protein
VVNGRFQAWRENKDSKVGGVPSRVEGILGVDQV